MANSHLVILKKPYLDVILAGRKTIESRFMKRRSAPFGKIAADDKLFFKVSSGPVCATAFAKKVVNFEDLTPERIDRAKRNYNDRIVGGKEYWAQRRDCRWGVLVWLEQVRRIEPIRIDKRDWRGWVVLTAKENFGLLTEQ